MNLVKIAEVHDGCVNTIVWNDQGTAYSLFDRITDRFYLDRRFFQFLGVGKNFRLLMQSYLFSPDLSMKISKFL